MSGTSPAASPTSPPKRFLAAWILLASALGAAIWAFVDLRREIADLGRRTASAETTLQAVLGEVTRFRIEQRAEGRGIHALLEKLTAFAPVLSSARTAAPDFEFAQREMDAVLRAIESLGADAWPTIEQRLGTLDVQSFDEQKWLLEAAVRADPQRGRQLVAEVLRGQHRQVRVSPRLRWYAADLLTHVDPPLGQRILREILSYESSRGIDPQRAAAYQIQLPGSPAASQGFHHFVVAYLRSSDPAAEDTLMMVIGRPEHDLVTVQECVKALGALKSQKAVKTIERLYRSPPGIHDNPLFQNHCLDALAAIQGREACPFLLEELKKAPSEMVVNRLKLLIQELGC
jgi:hypothetical protein